jgi:dihydrofolate reductase
MITIIVAFDNNYAIGKDNKLVWKQSNDLKRFKELTLGKTVVMGRKTYDSIGRPLPNRNNIVLTRSKLEIPGVKVINEVSEITETDYCVIGGSEIYKLFIDKADEILVTLIDCKIEADSWFPKISFNDWYIYEMETFSKDEKNQYDYTFLKYFRKN